MRRRQFIVGLPVLACSSSFAQDEQRINGVYELRVPYKGQGPDNGLKILMMRQVGGELKVRDLETGQEYRGNVSGNNVTFPLFLGSMISTPSIGATIRPYSFIGALTKTGLTGEVEAGGSKVEWHATRLTNVWLCSNHRPIHIAKSREEMVTYTKKNKCEGWRKARPEVG
jgi:hypothetical protein